MRTRQASWTTSPRLRALAGALLIFVTTVLAYLPSMRGGFTLDDDTQLTESVLVKAPDGLYRFWLTTEPIDYWPVIGTSFWVEWRLWGMDPTGYRVTNLVLHGVEAVLIWAILRRLSVPGALLAALLFAVHPVNVQSVAWIAQRKNLLAMLFFLLAIFSYLESEMSVPPQSGRSPPAAGRWYAASLAAFVLAMLSKGSVAVLPLLLLGVVRWLRPLTQRDCVRVAPFVLVSAILVPVNVWFQARAIGPVRGVDPIERLLGAAGVVWFYLYKALLPINLCFVYPQWHIRTDRLAWWLPLLGIVAVSGMLWRYRRAWSRPLLFGWGYFCVALVPVMGFTLTVYMAEQSLVADHYQHLALVAVVGLVGAGWATWRQRAHGRTRWLANAAAVVLVATLAVLTWRQSALYADSVTLFRATVERNPDSAQAHHNLGFVLVHAGRLKQGIDEYEQALRLDPDYRQAHNNLGGALALAGRRQEAMDHYERALALRPDDPDAQNNLGSMLREMGRPEESIAHFQQAIRLDPDFPAAHCNLGKALFQLGRSAEAIEQLQEALRLRPDFVEARDALTVALSPTDQRGAGIDRPTN